MSKTIVQKHAKNFNILKQAFKNDDVAILECTEIATKEKIAVICAVHKDKEGMINMVPFAKFFNGNPYDLILPPES